MNINVTLLINNIINNNFPYFNYFWRS